MPQTKYSQMIGLELMGLCLGANHDQLGESLDRRGWREPGGDPVGSETERSAKGCGEVPDEVIVAAAWSVSSCTVGIAG